MRMIPQKKKYLYALTAVLFWSTVATAFKLALRGMSPFSLILIASVVSFLVLLIVVIVQGKLRLLGQLPLRDYLYLMLLGLLNPVGYYLILFKAYQRLPAQIAQPVNMVWPFVLAFLSVPILKQKISWRSMWGLFISFAGVIVISSKGAPLELFNELSRNHSFLAGIGLALASSVFWAFYWILNVRNEQDPVIKLLLNFFFGSLALIIASLIVGFQIPPSRYLIPAIYIGLFETGITFVMWMKAMSYSDNNARIGNLIYLGALLSLVFIHFLLGEKIYNTTLIGFVFIVGGILFQQTEKSGLNDTHI